MSKAIPLVLVGKDAIVIKMPFHMEAKESLKAKVHYSQREWVPAEKVWKLSCTKENFDKVHEVVAEFWPGVKLPVFSKEGDVQATFDTAIDTTSYYTILAVPEKATTGEIKKAHRILVLKLHPDQNSALDAAKHFMLVQKAYKVLSSEPKRKKYDKMRVLTGKLKRNR